MADYASILGQVDVVLAQARSHITVVGDCHIADYKSSKGYKQVRYKGTKYYLHTVAAMKHTGRAPQTNEEASHLCHNASCVRPDHLVFEDGLVNKSRLCCELFRGKDGYRCPHNPTCFNCIPLSE